MQEEDTLFLDWILLFPGIKPEAPLFARWFAGFWCWTGFVQLSILILLTNFKCETMGYPVMKQENYLYEALYQSFASHFYLGNLKYGDSLPSLQFLCSQYGVSMAAVRGAFQKLEENGFISTSRGKRATVVFNPNTADCAKALLARRGGIADTFDAMALLMPDPFYVGVRCCEEAARARARSLLERAPGASERWRSLVDRTTELISLLLRPLRNPLLQDLLLEMRLFTRLPNFHLGVEEACTRRYFSEVDAYFDALLSDRAPAGRAALAGRFAEVCQQMKREELGYLDQIQDPPADGGNTAPFRWSVAKGQHICTTVALKLLMQIAEGGYPGGSLLPPVSTLMRQYGISSTTARNACRILCQMGIAQTQNGVGTRVVFPDTAGGMALCVDGELQKNILQFLDAMQIFALTIRRVACGAFLGMGADELQNLWGRLRPAIQEENGYRMYDFILSVITGATGSPCIRTVYGQLHSLLFWGIYLRLTHGPGPVGPECGAILEAVDRGDVPALAEALESFSLAEYRACLQRAETIGFPPGRMPLPLPGIDEMFPLDKYPAPGYDKI